MCITVYTKNDCVQCHATQQAMKNHGLTFDIINIDHHPEVIDILREQGFRQLPVVIAGDIHWSGFRPDMIKQLHQLAVAHA
ncbi:glutaredoxin-like protein NrdH [Enterobacteriaceae bacterium ESL0689]|nr:glutaredoxin-like protein NrdH [Enterobacteriaceae bacterium ESL0689]